MVGIQKRLLKTKIWVLGASTLIGLSASAPAWAGPDLRPTWLDSYRVRIDGLGDDLPNSSFLNGDLSYFGQKDGLLSDLIDPQDALVRRQQYQDLNRDYEMRERAGLVDRNLRLAHNGQVRDFSHGVVDSLEKRQIKKTERKVTTVVEKQEGVKEVAAPAVLLAGVYIGHPVKFHLTSDTLLSVRTNIRDRYGTFELDSPLIHTEFDYRPSAPATRDLSSSSWVDLNEEFKLGNTVDYSQERYQFSLSRELPVLDLKSELLYGASSNTVVGSVSKHLTDNLICVLDTVHWLTPEDPSRADEQKIRLRYDFHF